MSLSDITYDADTWQDMQHIMDNLDDVKDVDYMGLCALHLAARTGLVWKLYAVLMYPIDINQRGHNGQTAMAVAVRSGSLNMLTVLAGAGGNPHLYDRLQDTPLLWAAWSGRLDMVQFLVLEMKVNVEHIYLDGRNALMYAAAQNEPEVVEFLFARTETRNISDRDGANLMKLASPHSKVLDKLHELRQKEMLLLCRFFAAKPRASNVLLERQTLRLIRDYLQAPEEPV